MSALYRKYRPQCFDEIVGQENIKKIISQEIKRGEVAHAFLFVGPRGVGKTTLARIIAKSLNCLNRKEDEFEPCNECKSCKSIDNKSDFDIIEIDAASHTGVDNVRENIISVSKIALAPKKFKVFIIDEVHMLSTSAFNALLKTLEEPPKNVIFVLATTEAHKVPATIISRCQRFDFKKINFNNVVERLQGIVDQEKVKVDKSILENIAYNSEGCLRDAESLLSQVLSLDDKEICAEQAEIVLPTSDLNLVFSLVESLLNKKANDGITIINQAIIDGVDLSRMSEDTIEIFRKMLLVKINPELDKFTKGFDDNNKKKIIELSQSIEEAKIFNIIDILNKRVEEIKSCKISQLPIEMAVVEICLLDGNIVREQSEVVFTKTNNIIQNIDDIGNEISSNISPQKTIRLQDIEFIWSRVIQETKKGNTSLASILQNCALKNLNGNKLTIALRFEFHQKKLKETSNRMIVENLIKEAVGVIIEIDPIFDKDTRVISSNAPESNGEILDSLNEVFGDEIN